MPKMKLAKKPQLMPICSRTRCVEGVALSLGDNGRLVRYAPRYARHYVAGEYASVGYAASMIKAVEASPDYDVRVRLGEHHVEQGTELFPRRKDGRFIDVSLWRSRRGVSLADLRVETTESGRPGGLVSAFVLGPRRAASTDKVDVFRSALGPTVGRIVHYTNLGDRDRKYPPAIVPAMVTQVNRGTNVALKCFYPSGIFDMPSVDFTEAEAGTEEARGHWTWPART